MGFTDPVNRPNGFLPLRLESYPLQLRLYRNKIRGQSFPGLSSTIYLNLFCPANCQKELLRRVLLSQLLISPLLPSPGLKSMEMAGNAQVAGSEKIDWRFDAGLADRHSFLSWIYSRLVRGLPRLCPAESPPQSRFLDEEDLKTISIYHHQWS